MKYPFIIWESENAEVIACGPQRFRLLWNGSYVGRFSSCFAACLYHAAEFDT